MHSAVLWKKATKHDDERNFLALIRSTRNNRNTKENTAQKASFESLFYTCSAILISYLVAFPQSKWWEYNSPQSQSNSGKKRVQNQPFYMTAKNTTLLRKKLEIFYLEKYWDSIWSIGHPKWLSHAICLFFFLFPNRGVDGRSLRCCCNYPMQSTALGVIHWTPCANYFLQKPKKIFPHISR